MAAPQNPPAPAGARPWRRSVTPEITAWASSILNDPSVPMFATVTRQFGDAIALARVEWHTWTHRGGKLVTGVFRGVTLYELAAAASPARRPSPDAVGGVAALLLLFL